MADAGMAPGQETGLPAGFIVDFAIGPIRYKHWQVNIDGRVARLSLDVQENQTLVPGYELKLNSYDLGVDIELYDAVQRLRFEHPEVGAVVLTSAKERVFCAGANIKMLGQSDHRLKVNFCKFTNETRNAMEDASANSGQTYICAINGPAAGGGYELALACEHILLIDDGSSTVSLPELPTLAVLPGTGGLTRLVDKRHVRHDHADFLCTTSDGVRGKRALEWRLVDELAPRSKFEQAVAAKASEIAQMSDRPESAQGVDLTPLRRQFDGDHIRYSTVEIDLDRELGAANFLVKGPAEAPPGGVSGILAAGDSFWPLALACEHILLIDDGSSTVSLPELPMLAVLPGTGGLTRLVDKRNVRHDHADFLCTTSEGVRGKRALEWRLVDELTPRSNFDQAVAEKASEVAQRSDRPESARGIELIP